MIENGHIIALNDDAVEVGEKIPCNFNVTSAGREYQKTEDGRALYYDAKVLVQKASFEYDGLAIYDLSGNKVGEYTIGQRRLNQMVGLLEMKCFKY